jgi:hypothetical protein
MNSSQAIFNPMEIFSKVLSRKENRKGRENKKNQLLSSL